MRFILASAAFACAALSLSAPVQAQSRLGFHATSFAPVGGIPGAIANPAAQGLTPVSVVNGVPVRANTMAATQVVGFPTITAPLYVPAAPVIHGQAHCKGFARASDGSLVATSGGGFQSMILGADCDTLIQQTLDAGHGVVFSASVLFKGSSDTITIAAKRALKMTADAINATGGVYEVAGYASREGDRIANDYLSWRRAKAASYYLIRHGVQTQHLNIVGKGETTIFGPEMAVNRRVVVRKKA